MKIWSKSPSACMSDGISPGPLTSFQLFLWWRPWDAIESIVTIQLVDLEFICNPNPFFHDRRILLKVKLTHSARLFRVEGTSSHTHPTWPPHSHFPQYLNVKLLPVFVYPTPYLCLMGKFIFFSLFVHAADIFFKTCSFHKLLGGRCLLRWGCVVLLYHMQNILWKQNVVKEW